MLKGFEDAFVDAQANVISLCLELLKNSEKSADVIYVYILQNDDEEYIDAFFEKDGKLFTTNDWCSDAQIKEFFHCGIEYIESECYMSDVPRPFKQTLPEYNRLEDQLLCMIYTHFLGSTLDNAEQGILKDIDNAMLWYDLTYLLHEKQPLPKPQVYDEPDYTVRPFTDVEEEYLQIYRTFIQKLH